MLGGSMIKTFYFSRIVRSIVPRTLLRIAILTMALAPQSCSPVSTTSSKSPAKGSQEASPTTPNSIGGDMKLALPSWCRMTQSTEQLCFACEREDGGTSIPYEQCLTPSDSFQVERDCAFTDSGTKSITCAGTKSSEPFVMDVSLAKEKLASALPAFLIALKYTAQQKFPDHPEVKAASDELSDFFANRIAQIIRGEDLDRTSVDLGLLVNKHLSDLSLAALEAKKFGKKRAQSSEAEMPKDKALPATQAVNCAAVSVNQCAPANAVTGNTRYIPQSIKHAVWRRDRGVCTNCGTRRHLNFDHIRPLALGGSTTLDNLRLLCFQCNQRAGMRTFGVDKMRAGAT